MSDSIEKPVRLPPRSKQGMLLSLDGVQVATLIVAVAILWIFVSALGPLGLLAATPLAVPIAAAAVVRLHGFPAPTMFGFWLMKKLRTSMGGNSQKFRPEAVQPVGTLRLPGSAANLQIWDTDGLATVYQPGRRASVSITCELEAPGFLMKDIGERYQLAEQLSAVLASMTQRQGIKRVVFQERTSPTTIRTAREQYAEAATRRGRSDAAAQNYLQVLDAAEPFAVEHRNFITVTLDLVSLAGQVKALGGGKKAAQAVARVEARNITDALTRAEIKVRRWLTPRGMAALARTAFDPAFLSTVQNRDDEHAGVDLTAIGPIHLDEPAKKHDRVYTDSGVHTTMWIHEWPRMDSRVGFVEPVVFSRDPMTGEAVTHIFSIVATPIPVSKALKNIAREKRLWEGNAKLRAKRGENDSAADRADWDALIEREDEIQAGQGMFSYGGYLTITGKDDDSLERAVAGAGNAMGQVGMEGQILYCQQPEALLTNVLPLGLGMK
ncbi:SCO6880 family protein [Microbacterium sp. NPDC055988]|uniref:SCO6880 family protein n=1 Tax=Microbacterium sp. NPDC055988 TaxID=3345671 RepID=UPI0035DAB417